MDGDETSVWGTTCSSQLETHTITNGSEVKFTQYVISTKNETSHQLVEYPTGNKLVQSKCADGDLCFCSLSSTSNCVKKKKKNKKQLLSVDSLKKCRQLNINRVKSWHKARAARKTSPKEQLTLLRSQINFMRSSRRSLSDTYVKQRDSDVKAPAEPTETDCQEDDDDQELYQVLSFDLENQKGRITSIKTSTPIPKYTYRKRCPTASHLHSVAEAKLKGTRKDNTIHTSTPRASSKKGTSRANSKVRLQQEKSEKEKVLSKKLQTSNRKTDFMGSSFKVNNPDKAENKGNGIKTNRQKRLKCSTPKQKQSKCLNEKFQVSSDNKVGASSPLVSNSTVCDTITSCMYDGSRPNVEHQGSNILPVTSTPYQKAQQFFSKSTTNVNKQQIECASKPPLSCLHLAFYEENKPRHGHVAEILESISPIASFPSVEDLDLSTPKIESRDNQLTPPMCSLKFDSRLDKDDCDSDEDSDDDLPAGITSIQQESKSLAVCDLVWIKWKKWPYLPAMVKTIYKKKKRVTVIMFTQDKEEFSISYSRPGSVLPFCHPRREEFQNSIENMDHPEDRNYCMKCMELVRDYFAKKILQGLPGNDLSYFRKDDYSPSARVDDDTTVKTTSLEPGSIRSSPLSSDSKNYLDADKDCISKLSQKGLQRKEKLRQKSQVITDFITSDDSKNHLLAIYNGEIKSEVHDIFFTGTSRERSRLKHKGFGPIDDDGQIETILSTYTNWLCKVNKNPYLHEVNYVFDVWIPEALVYAFRCLHKYSKKQSWDKFYRGVRRTKEELKILHEEIISGSNISKMEEEEKE